MFKKSALLAASLGVLSFGAATVSAAPAEGRQWELLLAGAGSSDNEFDGGGFQLNAQVGYYFTDALQVNVRQSAGYSDFGDSSWNAGTRVGVDYHFDLGADQRVVPFVGVAAGYLYGDATNDTWIAGPEGGVKFYVNDTTFIYGSVAYEFLFDDAEEADDSFSDGQFVYAVGVGFRW